MKLFTSPQKWEIGSRDFTGLTFVVLSLRVRGTSFKRRCFVDIQTSESLRSCWGLKHGVYRVAGNASQIYGFAVWKLLPHCLLRPAGTCPKELARKQSPHRYFRLTWPSCTFTLRRPHAHTSSSLLADQMIEVRNPKIHLEVTMWPSLDSFPGKWVFGHKSRSRGEGAQTRIVAESCHLQRRHHSRLRPSQAKSNDSQSSLWPNCAIGATGNVHSEFVTFG